MNELSINAVKLVSQLNMVHELFQVYDIQVYYGENRENNWIDVQHPMIEPISELATDVVFTSRGHVERKNISYLKDSGYTVFPVEVDKHFGWIIAGIEIPDIGVLAVYNDNLDNRWKRRA